MYRDQGEWAEGGAGFSMACQEGSPGRAPPLCQEILGNPLPSPKTMNSLPAPPPAMSMKLSLHSK